jgi:hypothetical protein
LRQLWYRLILTPSDRWGFAMFNAPCVSARIPRAAKILDCSDATIWNKINQNELAFFRDGGITRIIVDWIGEPPPREGRALSLKEYIEERMVNPVRKRTILNSVHRGRPRKRPIATDRGHAAPMEARKPNLIAERDAE